MLMTLEAQRAAVSSALTQYDAKQASKRGYNSYALAQYYKRLNECYSEAAGRGDVTLERALRSGFCDRVLTAALKAIGV